MRTDPEASRSKGFSFFEGGDSVALQDVQNGAVVVHGRNDDHVVEVLGGPSDQCNAPDVDLFDNVGFRGAAGHGRLERVQIHDDQVNAWQVVFRHLGLIAFVVAAI